MRASAGGSPARERRPATALGVAEAWMYQPSTAAAAAAPAPAPRRSRARRPAASSADSASTPRADRQGSVQAVRHTMRAMAVNWPKPGSSHSGQ
jgi:hypothetical protein